MHLRLLVTACAIAFTTVIPESAATQQDTPRIPPDVAEIQTRLDSMARAFVESGQTPGLSAFVLRGADTLLQMISVPSK